MRRSITVNKFIICWQKRSKSETKNKINITHNTANDGVSTRKKQQKSTKYERNGIKKLN